MSESPTPLKQLADAGVSIWLDDLSRERLDSGSLTALVQTHGVVGVTTNPTIFANALANGDAYSSRIAALAASGSDDDAVEDAVFTITTEDVADAARLLAPIAEQTGGVNGRVSIEVDPRLSRDTAGTLAAAQTLWSRIDQPNLLIKIPATVEGLPAIRDAIAAGISVNVTLIFDVERHRDVTEAYLAGLELAAAAGIDLASIHSVASVFVARVDSEVDARLDAIGTASANVLRGKAGIANARTALAISRDAFSGPRWDALAALGAHPQRVLWASTAPRDPAYADTVYVGELVEKDTVNTMPERVITAFDDHGVIVAADDRDDPAAVLSALDSLGIDYADVVSTLEREGLEIFERSWDELLATVRGLLEAAR